MENNPNRPEIAPGGIDGLWVLRGTIWGCLLGAMIGLFVARRSGPVMRQELARTGQTLANRLEETLVPGDPLSDSIAQGKAAARRRRSDLGIEREP